MGAGSRLGDAVFCLVSRLQLGLLGSALPGWLCYMTLGKTINISPGYLLAWERGADAGPLVAT